jgi:hypothetical protein
MKNIPIIDPTKVRRINGGFSFIPHRFLKDGFFKALDQDELLLYFFLVLASNQHGISWYSDESIIKFIKLSVEDLLEAKQRLIDKKLIINQPPFYQVLELPAKAYFLNSVANIHPLQRIKQSLLGADHDR